MELHGFFDASNSAYSAVVYSRAIFQNKIVVKIVSAKSKIVPKKVLSIPRIELLSGLLLSKLMNKVFSTMSAETDINKIVCWTDSLVFLWWSKKSDKD